MAAKKSKRSAPKKRPAAKKKAAPKKAVAKKAVAKKAAPKGLSSKKAAPPKRVPRKKVTTTTARPQRRPPAASRAAPALSDLQLERALSDAASLGDTRRLADLLADSRVASKPWRNAALTDAAREGRTDAMRVLLDAGADPNAIGTYGSALSYALNHGMPSVRLLLDRGASPDSPSINGMTVLHRAVELALVDEVKALLAAGADPRREDNAGMTPLHIAAHRAIEAQIPPELIDVLVAHGAHTEAGSNHSTPLLWAVGDGQMEHVQRLLAHGADVDAVAAGMARKSALHVAFERGNDAMARLLIEHGADRSKRDHTGLDLAGVYGPWGEDTRRLEVHYVPSAETQRLDVTVELCVLHPAHLPHFFRADFSAAMWANLVNDGVTGGAQFAPEAGCAQAVTSIDYREIAREGVYERSLSLDVAGVAPAFLGVLARALFGSPTTFTGAGAFAPLRVVGMTIRGSRPGESAVDGPTVRRWVAGEPPHLPAFHGEMPFLIHVDSGSDPSLRIVPAIALPEGGEQTVQRHAQSWLAMQTTWERTVAHDGTPVSLVTRGFSAANPVMPLVRLGKTGAEAKSFPYEVASARATLANAMRSLASRIPLAEVVLTVPES